MAAEPDTVNKGDPFVPAVKLKPVVDASVIVPCATDSVREFEPLPAAPLMLMALPLRVEKSSNPFCSSVREGGATIAGALSAVAAKTTVVAADRLSPRSESDRDKDSDPACVALGLSVRPLSASFRLAAEPDTVPEGEPLAPVVKFDPIVGPRVSLPRETDCEIESELRPAAASTTELALWLTLGKTVIGGATRALVVSDALVELDSASTG